MPLRDHLGIAATAVTDLSPISRMQITDLDLYATDVTDLSPIADVPLIKLNIRETKVRDISPLLTMNIHELLIDYDERRDRKVLLSLPNLKLVNGMEAAEFFLSVGLLKNAEYEDDHPGNGIAEKRLARLFEELIVQRPDFDPQSYHFSLKQGRVRQLECSGEDIPVKLLPGLKGLESLAITVPETKVLDLKTIGRLDQLTELEVTGACRNLAALSRLPLARLSLQQLSDGDLSPLSDLPLRYLKCSDSSIADLSALSQCLILESVFLDSTSVSDLTPLQGIALRELGISNTQVTDLTCVRQFPLVTLHAQGLAVDDTSALASLPLRHLKLDFDPKRDVHLFQSLNQLEYWNGKTMSQFWQANE